MTMRLWGPPATQTRQIHAGPAIPGRLPHCVHQVPGGICLYAWSLPWLLSQLTAAPQSPDSPRSVRDLRSSAPRSPDTHPQPCAAPEAQPSGPRQPPAQPSHVFRSGRGGFLPHRVQRFAAARSA